jgi:hypothetical protein
MQDVIVGKRQWKYRAVIEEKIRRARRLKPRMTEMD